MQQRDLARWEHRHDYGGDTAGAERRTRLVIGVTAAMMAVEIAAGMFYQSMALLADGWHMSTHVAAFVIAAAAYHFSRRHARDWRYSFGTGKMGVLGGFASAVLLSVVALFMAGESIHRYLAPVPIQFNQAIGVACLGLVVNLACAVLLQDHPHSHGHDHAGGAGHHHDLNLRSAYVHVLADALTSVTAIIALLFGKYFGWLWLDPVMGVVGSVVVGIWAFGLLRDTSGVLLDRTPEACDLPDEITRAVQGDGDAQVSDLHVWQVAAGKYAAIVSIVAHSPRRPEVYRQRLREHEELVHVTIEVQECNPVGAALAAG